MQNCSSNWNWNYDISCFRKKKNEKNELENSLFDVLKFYNCMTWWFLCFFVISTKDVVSLPFLLYFTQNEFVLVIWKKFFNLTFTKVWVGMPDWFTCTTITSASHLDWDVILGYWEYMARPRDVFWDLNISQTLAQGVKGSSWLTNYTYFN